MTIVYPDFPVLVAVVGIEGEVRAAVKPDDSLADYRQFAQCDVTEIAVPGIEKEILGLVAL